MKEHKEDIIKIIVTAVLLVAAMLVTSVFSLPVWAQILIFLIPYIIIGGEVLKEAAENIIHGEIFDECFLMGIATIGAFCIGEYPEAVFVMLFFAVGELLEHIAVDKSKKSINSLINLRPDKANKQTANGIITVSPEEIVKGDILIIKPGEKIPVDGIITDGSSSVDTCSLTGESIPADVTVGDKVLSGCININGLIKISAEGGFNESTAAKIIRLMEESSKSKARTESFIKRFAKYYTPVVVILAIFVAVVPSIIFGDFSLWLYRALMMLVVSCPCALVVSIPLTYFSGIGGASKKGILIKNAATLENISKIKNIVFDKTGTLTKGSFSVSGVYPEKIEEKELLLITAAAEKYSNHPVSKAILKAAENIENIAVTDVEEMPGFGIKANVSGKTVFAGNDRLMNKISVNHKDSAEAGTVVHICIDGEYAGHIVITDSIKEDSLSAVNSFKSKGIKPHMLTGDNAVTAKAIAESIGIEDFFYSLLPEQKVMKLKEIIEKSSEKERTAFVGDGVNDAPVLAMADIGFAMGAMGSDAAIGAADVVLMDDKPSKIFTAFKISQKTNRIVLQNIIFSLSVKIGILILSIAGLSNMWFAAFADAGVLVIAVINSIRVLKN